MNFFDNHVNISAVTKWCQRGIVLTLLSLIMACGGGGGGSTLTAAEIEKKFKLENTTTRPAPYYPNDQLIFKATYPVGEAQIIVTDKTENKVIETISLGDQYSDKQYVAVAPKAGSYSYSLKVTYQDPSISRPSIKEWSSPAGIVDIFISSPPVAPQYFSSVSWTTNRADHAAVKLGNGNVLISGGTDGTNVLKSAMIFDSVNATWAAVPDMKTARRGHTMTLLNSGKVLVTGGFDGKTSLATAEVYDPGQNAWLPTGPMNLSRRFHTATSLPDKTVLILGGIVGLLPTDDPTKVEIYDEATGKFTYGTSISEARMKHTATLINNKVLLTGNSDNSAIAWLYDYINKTWTKAGALSYPLDRYSHSAEAMNSTQVMISGGYVKNKDGVKAISNAVEIYDAQKNEWDKNVAPMNTARALHSSTKLTNGSILVVGGHDGQNVLDTAEIFDLDTKTWRKLGKLLNTTRAFHSAIKLDNDDVLISGTYFQTSGKIVSTTEVIKEADTNK